MGISAVGSARGTRQWLQMWKGSGNAPGIRNRAKAPEMRQWLRESARDQVSKKCVKDLWMCQGTRFAPRQHTCAIAPDLRKGSKFAPRHLFCAKAPDFHQGSRFAPRHRTCAKALKLRQGSQFAPRHKSCVLYSFLIIPPTSSHTSFSSQFLFPFKCDTQQQKNINRGPWSCVCLFQCQH